MCSGFASGTSGTTNIQSRGNVLPLCCTVIAVQKMLHCIKSSCILSCELFAGMTPPCGFCHKPQCLNSHLAHFPLHQRIDCMRNDFGISDFILAFVVTSFRSVWRSLILVRTRWVMVCQSPCPVCCPAALCYPSCLCRPVASPLVFCSSIDCC